jgi:soluble lytic murein transglycosylase-like protein
MNRLNLISHTLLFLSLMGVQTLRAEIYSYIDAKGVRVYTDTPPEQSRRSTSKLSPPATATSTSPPTTMSGATGIYKWIDAQGITHYTDQPRHQGYRLIYQGGQAILSFDSQEADATVKALPTLSERYEDYKPLIEEAASYTALEPALLHAVIQTESAYNPKAVSPKGAVGLMQLMPTTAEWLGVTDLTDESSNIYGGARYLRYLLEMFDNNLRLALAAYNAGETAVKRYGNKIPPYRETRNYVNKVMNLYQAYRERL